MKRAGKLRYVVGSIPFVMLVLALPFVNRLEPVVLGLPFLLFWIVFWIALTPPVLFAVYLLEGKSDDAGQGDES